MWTKLRPIWAELSQAGAKLGPSWAKLGLTSAQVEPPGSQVGPAWNKNVAKMPSRKAYLKALQDFNVGLYMISNVGMYMIFNVGFA